MPAGLLSWELLGQQASQWKDLVSLSTFRGGHEVSDYLRKFKELCKKSLNQSRNIAEGLWEVLQNNLQLATVKPPRGTGALSLPEIRKLIETLEGQMEDSSVLDDISRRKDAGSHPMPTSILLAVFMILKACAEYACAFDSSAWSMRNIYAAELEEHESWFRKFLDAYPNKMSAEYAYDLLADMNDNLMALSKKSAADGNARGYNAARVHHYANSRTRSPQVGPDQGRQRQVKQHQGGDDLAAPYFQHMGNPAQEGAADRERRQSAADRRRTLLNLPKDPDTRRAAIKDGLCKFNWEAGLRCTRGKDCPFAHLSQADTAKAGISNEEIVEVFSMIGQRG